MLADYRRRVKAQFDVLEQDAWTQRDKFDAVVAEIKPVLDCVEPEAAPQPNGRPTRLDIIVERCKTAWESFKGFNRDGVASAATHVLAVVWSHYPTADLQAIGGGYAEGLSDVETQQLEDEVEDAAKKLAGDIDLFGEMDGGGKAQ